ncbi:MAG: putative FAD-dependent dehydrogenase [Polaribacter sp.]
MLLNKRFIYRKIIFANLYYLLIETSTIFAPMIKTVDINLSPTEATNEELVTERAMQASGAKKENITSVKLLKRSVDARGRKPIVRLRLNVFIEEVYSPEARYLDQLKEGATFTKKVIVVGAGPAGYFAALELLSLGIQPIVFDRGKDVRARRRDLKAIQQYGEVNPHSNYCYGEGGAGTYSDGKLYTRSGKRGSIDEILKILVEHGAKEDIMIDAHPHIGSNKLPTIVANIRETILAYGGEIHFDAHVTDLIIKNKKIEGVVVNEETEHFSDAVILATGHSARDVFYLLDKKGVRLESKPFALGVRVEHPQALIDQLQYNQSKREDALPAASYSLACQVGGQGVFSFCMCPGGLVVPAATAPGEIVVNGMSLSRRDSPYANSGIVTAVDEKDYAPFAEHGVFAGLAFQKSVEQAMFNIGDGSQKGPAQRMTDFVAGKVSKDLADSSYIPGLIPAPVHELLPKRVYESLRKGMMEFGRKMKGFYGEGANVIGTESRTSSPVRIPRNKETLMNDEVDGLFPCGEGGGYAGGIVSAAIDGRNVAGKVSSFFE